MSQDDLVNFSTARQLQHIADAWSSQSFSTLSTTMTLSRLLFNICFLFSCRFWLLKCFQRKFFFNAKSVCICNCNALMLKLLASSWILEDSAPFLRHAGISFEHLDRLNFQVVSNSTIGLVLA